MNRALLPLQANMLLQMYEVTKEEKYLEGAKLQLKVLELFNGIQPDYHLYETAIRHWDGYWFGKETIWRYIPALLECTQRKCILSLCNHHW